jgi:hypothetical protein
MNICSLLGQYSAALCSLAASGEFLSSSVPAHLLIANSGGADESQLMEYIGRFARVQSCIVNHDKRHAFLKLNSHQDAINVKAAVDQRPEAEYRHLFERVRPNRIFLDTEETNMQ